MKKVLVADDTKNIRILLSTCLELKGYEITLAENGEEAFKFLSTDDFELAFIDIRMPELSGTEVLRKIREMGIRTNIIIMTAYPTVKNAVECTKLGAVSYLQKPFTPERIQNLIDEINNIPKYSESIYEIIETAKEQIDSGNLTGAFDTLKESLSKDPEYSETYYLLSFLYEKTGDIELSRLFKDFSFKLKNLKDKINRE